MKRCDKLLSLFATLATGGAMLFATSSANAAFVLTLDDTALAGGPEIIISDDAAIGTATYAGNTTTADGSAGLGAINYNGAIAGGVWGVNVTTGISDPIIGPNDMDLNSVNVSSTGAGTLVITLTDTDFDAGTLAGGLAWLTDIGGTTGGTISAQVWVDPTNAEGGMGAPNLVADIGPLGPGAFSASVLGLTNPLDGPFSATIQVTIVHTGAGQISSFDAETSVPEPATLGLLGAGLLAMGAVARRRMKAAA